MKTSFYFKVEPWKGYIPSDKVSYAGQPFEIANSIVSKPIRDHYAQVRKEQGAREAMKAVKDGIQGSLLIYLQSQKAEQKDPTKKPFYINFNADGFDVFISRWNWKFND